MQKVKEALIALTVQGVNVGVLEAGVPLNKHLVHRDSLIHKLGFLDISRNYVIESLGDLKKKLASVDPRDPQGVYNSCFQATQLMTYHLECFIYHLLSSLENLKSIIPFFYKDLSHATSSMRQMYDSIIGQKKLANKKIYSFVQDKKYAWLITAEGDGLYDYRAKIYHWVSNLCGSTATLSFPTDDFSYKLQVHLPPKLAEIIKCPQDIGIDIFVNKLIAEYQAYILDLLSAIREDIQ